MLELISYNNEIINTKTRITIDMLKEGVEFLKQFDINQNLLPDTMSIINKFLKKIDKLPHNIYKFFIAAYYIVSRHPIAFPVHKSKKDFCDKFSIKQSSLDYSLEKILCLLNYIKIQDDMNYPYFIDTQKDIGFNLLKTIVKSEVERNVMNYFQYNQTVNSKILSEELISKIIFQMKIFPEELFRQFYHIIFNMVKKELDEHSEYLYLQQKYLL
ncbi:MAG: hypothetical protein KGD63_09390 [Candidatus Lokiarchaeota archaeon]|nr:hypothetical protein [Candidatus Lokiarchaeota archaeon]